MPDYDNEYINNPVRSKINIISVVMMIIGLLGVWQVVDPFLLEKIQQSVLILGPATVIMFRTFFTGRRKQPNQQELQHACKCADAGDEQQNLSVDGSCWSCGGRVPSYRDA